MVPGLAGMAGIPYTRVRALQHRWWSHLGDRLRLARLLRWGRLAPRRGRCEPGRPGAARRGDARPGPQPSPQVRARGHRAISDRLARGKVISWVRERFPNASGWAARRIDIVLAERVRPELHRARGCDLRLGIRGDSRKTSSRRRNRRSLDLRVSDFIVAHRDRMGDGDDEDRDLARVQRYPDHARVPGGSLTFLVQGPYWRPSSLMIAALAGANLLYRIMKSSVGRAAPALSRCT